MSGGAHAEDLLLTAQQRFASLSLHRSCPLLFADGAAIKEPPAEIELCYAGDWVTHPNGPFKVDATWLDKVVANCQRYPTRPVIDLEHSSIFFTDRTPAQGWIESVSVKNDASGRLALVAQATWSDVGRENVLQRRFRYLSQAVWPNDKDRNTGADIGPRLDSVALCKKPYIESLTDLAPFSLAFNFPGRGRADREEEMDPELLKKLRLLFKAPASADEGALIAMAATHEGAILAAVERRPMFFFSADAVAALGLAVTATAQEVSDKIILLASNATAADKLGQRVVALEYEQHEVLFAEALAAFKVTPAEKEEQLQLAKANPLLFKSLLAKRPSVPPAGELGTATRERGQKPAGQGGVNVDADDPQKLFTAQIKAIEEYCAKNAGATEHDAVIALSRTNRELFPEYEQEDANG